VAKNIHRLPDNFLNKNPKPGKHHDGGGLYVIVKTTGTMQFVLRYTINGKRRAMGLGSNRTYTLIEARERARAAWQLIDQEIDPAQAKKEDRKKQDREQAQHVTVAEAAADYVQALERRVLKQTGSLKNLKQAQSVIKRFINPALGDLVAWNVEGNEVADLIMRIAERTPSMAEAVEAHGRLIFKRAQQLGRYPQGKINPFSRKGPLGVKLEDLEVEPPQHHAGLPAAEVPAFMQRLRAPKGGGPAFLIAEAAEATGKDRSEILRLIHMGKLRAYRPQEDLNKPGWTAPWFIEPDNLFKLLPRKGEPLKRPLNSMASLALQFIILMAARPEQVLTMRWNDYDPVQRIWTVPWWRHKIGRRTKKPLIMPVSSAGTAVLDQAGEFQKGPLGANSEFVFAHGTAMRAESDGTYNGRPLAANAIQNAFDAVIGQPGFTVYGFRSSFCTWAYEHRPHFHADAIEMSLGHVRRMFTDKYGSRRTDTTREAYDHAQLIPERKELMEAWGGHCTKPAPVASKVVVPAEALDQLRKVKAKAR
jgi:hypothetical protein